MGDSKKTVEHVFLSKNCGLKVSNICLGAMTFGEFPLLAGQNTEEQAHAILDRFVELGGNFIDTANVYSSGKSEECVGTWLKKRQNRNKLVIATKCRLPSDPGNPNGEGLSRKHILEAVEESLKRLQTDYIDLYQVHYWDDGTPLKEVVSTLNDLVRAGKVRYVGASNFSGWQIQKTVDMNHYLGYNPWVTLQQEYNLWERGGEAEPFEVCKREGLGILPWSPLKSGLLTGKYKKDQKPSGGSRIDVFKTNMSGVSRNDALERGAFPVWQMVALDSLHHDRLWRILDTLDVIRQEVGKTTAQVALRWLLQKPAVTSVIIGAKTMAQLEENMAAGAGWELSKEQMERLDAAAEYNHGDFYTLVSAVQKGRERGLPGGF